eukprot:1160636-Pelagomonas_calceolata.AAC.2
MRGSLTGLEEAEEDEVGIDGYKVHSFSIVCKEERNGGRWTRWLTRCHGDIPCSLRMHLRMPTGCWVLCIGA